MSARSAKNFNHLEFLPRVQFEDYEFTCEPYGLIITEIERLYALHWQETEQVYRDEYYKPDHARYTQLANTGSLMLCVPRTFSGQMVGYLMFFFLPDLHRAGKLKAMEGGIFIDPEHRKGRLGLVFFDYGERCVKQMGAATITASCKAPVGGPKFGVILRRRGYRHFADLYTKEI